MRTSKFTNSQILAILKEYESGQTAKELYRKYGFHYQSLHDWKKKFSGISSTKELQKNQRIRNGEQPIEKDVCQLEFGT